MDGSLSFRDIIKNSLLKTDLFGAINLADVVLGLLITFVLAMFVFYVYKKTYSGVLYSHNFNVSLVLMAMVTSIIITTISSNLVLSLGMVGALSIVRFRTAVKDPMDIVFMFWAISLGITTGAKLYMVAAIGSTFVGVVTVFLLKYKNSNNVYMLIVHYEEEAKEILFKRLSELDYTLKSKTLSDGVTELTIELKIIGTDTSFMEKISDIEGIIDVSLVSYNGNFVG